MVELRKIDIVIISVLGVLFTHFVLRVPILGRWGYPQLGVGPQDYTISVTSNSYWRIRVIGQSGCVVNQMLDQVGKNNLTFSVKYLVHEVNLTSVYVPKDVDRPFLLLDVYKDRKLVWRESTDTCELLYHHSVSAAS